MATKIIYNLIEFDCGTCESSSFRNRKDALDIAEKEYYLDKKSLADLDKGFIITLPSGSSLAIKQSTLV